MATTRVVQGEVLLPSTGVPERAAAVVVQVEDVSRADAPSVVVGELRLRDVRLDPGRAIAFEVEVPVARIDPRGTYSVRVHVDVSGSGDVEVGDLLTTQSYPVLTRGSPDRVQVRTRQV